MLSMEQRTTPTASPAWHTVSGLVALERLGSGTRGLSVAQAADRIATHGPNRLRVTPLVSPWRILAQFRSVVPHRSSHRVALLPGRASHDQARSRQR